MVEREREREREADRQTDRQTKAERVGREGGGVSVSQSAAKINVCYTFAQKL